MKKHLDLILAFAALALVAGVGMAYGEERPAVRPYSVECSRCTRDKTVDRQGQIITNRARCRKCRIEFRELPACAVVPFPPLPF